MDAFYLLMAKLLSFFSVFYFIFGIKFLIANRNSNLDVDQNLPFTYRGFIAEIAYFRDLAGRRLVSALPQQTASIKKHLQLSALSLDVPDVYGAQLFWALITGIVCGIIMFILMMPPGYIIFAILLGLFIGWLLPVVQIQKIGELRQNSIRRSLPFAVDLITAAMLSGLDFVAAVRYYVGQETSGPLSNELGITLKFLELGHSRTDALKAMSDRIQIDEFRSLVNAVIQGAEMGASISDTMRINAEEMRRARSAAAERKAQRAPSLMMIPMALFIMPSVFIIIFVPIYLRVKLSGMGNIF